MENEKNTITQEHINKIMEQSKLEIMEVFGKVTIVSMKLPSGFVITESSACVDPKNYDREIGISICRKRIEGKIWELEGYLLQSSMNKT